MIILIIASKYLRGIIEASSIYTAKQVYRCRYPHLEDKTTEGYSS